MKHPGGGPPIQNFGVFDPLTLLVTYIRLQSCPRKTKKEEQKIKKH